MSLKELKKPSIYQILGSLPGILLYVALAFSPLGSTDPAFYTSIGISALLVNLWIAEPVPLWVSSILPLILLPLHGILDPLEALGNYHNKTIFLFLGGFLLAYAVEKSHLHKRIAFRLLALTGDNPKGIIWGMMLATCLISMWISNTATAIMMLPVALSITSLTGHRENTEYRPFFLCMMLGIAYAANIGGIATVIGTPPNIVYKGYVDSMKQPEISFLKWMLIGVPLSLLMLWLTYHLLVNFIYKIKINSLPQVAAMLDNQAAALGKMKSNEKRTLIVFSAAVFFWIFAQPLNNLMSAQGIKFKIEEHIVAMVFALLLFIVPGGKSEKSNLLKTNDLKFISWGILILFGGGMCMAKGLESTGVIKWVGEYIKNSQSGNLPILLLLLTGSALYITELMSNVALAQIYIPVVFGIASSMGLSNPHMLGLPVVFACSFAFMFPISTPPNAVVFSSGFLKIKDMAIAGFFINIVGIVLLWLVGLYIIPLLF
ncbi:MAG TPA: DASS family sodium-coupled anion symporter [Bacteroidia bacterium]